MINENHDDSPLEEGANIYTRSIAYKTHDIYIAPSVESSEVYTDVVNCLNRASKNDKINLYLSNFGGSCHGCIFLVNAVKASKAKVHCIVMAPCYSAGSTLALCGDSLEMRDNTFLMFHNYSSMTGGKGGELKLSVKETNRWIHKYFKDIHCPFLTAVEANRLERDQDIYIHSNDKSLKSRMKRHFKCS